MYVTNNIKGLMKKTIAVILGITMAFGALTLPAGKKGSGFVTAHADTVEVGECTFDYSITDRTGKNTIRINSVTFTGDTVEVPSSVKVGDEEYPVTDIADEFLNKNKEVKTVIFPDTVKFIGEQVLMDTNVEKIVLPDGLEHLGFAFGSSCSNLTDVEYSGTSITEIDSYIFNGCYKIRNEKNAICLGNWLIYAELHDIFFPEKYNMDEIRIADLNTSGTKIDSIAPGAISRNDYATTLDLEGIKYIGNNNFNNFPKLTTLKNADEVEEVGNGAFNDTPWLNDAKEKGLVQIGATLLYYKTDDNVIDLTKNGFENVRNIYSSAMAECTNVDTIIVNSDCIMSGSCFYVANPPKETGGNDRDILPETPYMNIKKIVIDGNELTTDLIKKDEKVRKWVEKYGYSFTGSVIMKALVEQKTKDIFKQMDITYYGPGNDKIGTLSPTEEFYIRLKIHNYLNQFYSSDYICLLYQTTAFLAGGRADSLNFAYYAQYMLECAGVESKSLYCQKHYWNSTKIGDEWFETDDAWDARSNERNFSWFGQSSSRIVERNPGEHTCNGAYDSFHDLSTDNTTKRVTAKRTLGDVTEDNIRDKRDSEALWAYLKGDSDKISMKAADVNFDGKVNITDGVLLENLVNEKAVDVNNMSDKGYAPTVKVAFVNGTDYDNIKYAYTDHDGYITLPDDLFEAPAGKKLSYDIGKAGKKVRITTPLTVVKVKWEDDLALGDVNGDGKIDIEDAVSIIQQINGLKPLTAEQEKRADVSKDGVIDIDDAVVIIGYVNGNNTI